MAEEAGVCMAAAAGGGGGGSEMAGKASGMAGEGSGMAKQKQKGRRIGIKRGPRQWKAKPASEPEQSPDEEAPPSKIYFYVKGYPPSTSPQDVVSAFSEFLPVTVTERNASGIMLCSEDVAAFRTLPRDMCVNGQPVQVFNRGSDGKLGRREFPRTKQQSQVRDPKTIPMEGKFSEQACAVLNAIRLPPGKVAQLFLLYVHVEEALGTYWPGCRALPFGSLTTGLGMVTSDADCFVLVPEQYYRADGQLVTKAQKVLRKYPHYFTEIMCITGASTPIVKFFHLPTGFKCDLSFKSILGVQNSLLVGTLMQVNGGLLPCMVLVKYWARVHDLTGTGRLSNYALTMLFLFYIQVQTGLIPPVEELQRDPASVVDVSGWNAGFSLPKQHTTDLPLHALLGGFFKFYAEFDFERLVVCPFLGRPLPKSAFSSLSELPACYGRYVLRVSQEGVVPIKYDRPVCVQDPFDLAHNVASAISRHTLEKLSAHIAFAANAYSADSETNTSSFLRGVLLAGPEGVDCKGRGVFEPLVVHLGMMEAETLLASARTVLQHMLALQLCDVPEREGELRSTHVASWETLVDQPIWKRKRFNNIYKKMNFDFIETQAKITQEVITVLREEVFLRLRIRLRVRERAGRQHATFIVVFMDGDMDSFVEIKSFFRSILHKWLRVIARMQRETSELDEQDEEEEQQEDDKQEDDAAESDATDSTELLDTTTADENETLAG